MQPAQLGHHVGAGPEHEVVGVGQEHFRPEGLEVGGREAPDRSPGAHGHEAGGPERAPGRGDQPGPGVPVGGLERQREGHRRDRDTSMASPNDKKR